MSGKDFHALFRGTGSIATGDGFARWTFDAREIALPFFAHAAIMSANIYFYFGFFTAREARSERAGNPLARPRWRRRGRGGIDEKPES